MRKLGALDRISAPGARVATDVASDGTAVDVVELTDPNALASVIGHIKFAFAPGATIVYRGQGRVHPGLVPSAYRGREPGERRRANAHLGEYVSELMRRNCSCKAGTRRPVCDPWWPCQDVMERKVTDAAIVAGTPRVAIEPLLQHYGLRTRWLDVVDNAWVALWFACHRLAVEHRRYAHHQRRSAAQEPDGFAYVEVLSAGVQSPTPVPGVSRSADARLVDLRYSSPSIYLRPHAQHGLLVASSDWTEDEDPDLARLRLAILRIKLSDALDWLGTGSMLSTYVLFPPATRDEGYRRLLDYAPDPPRMLGQFLVYGPGA